MVRAKRASKFPRNDFPRRWTVAPLKGTFMITAILGFLVSAYLVYPRSINYGIAFMIVFAAMFFASLISMTHLPTSLQDK